VSGTVTLPVLRALLDQARNKNYASGVLGVRARPEWPGPASFSHDNVPVRVVPCVSALAVREALLEREYGQWLVVLTDRADDDLGAGVLGHLVWNRLRTPDPWDAVRLRFAATGVEPALTDTSGDREIAAGLLAAAPPSGWPPAPGGVLTRDHALGAVAAGHLGLNDPVVDATSVLTWTTDPDLITRLADLRSLAGDTLSRAVLDWAAEHIGSVAQALRPLLLTGEAKDAVPLGLVTGLLADARDGKAAARSMGETGHDSADAVQLAREALIRLEPRLGNSLPPTATLLSWAREAAAVVAGMLRDPTQQAKAMSLLSRADDLLAGTHALSLADGSDLLPAGLTRRVATLAARLRGALPATAAREQPDAPQIPAATLAGIEEAWISVAAHSLADTDPRTAAFHAAVRLARWLSTDSSASTTSLPALLRRHAQTDAWVDSAVNDAAPGISDPDLGAGLAAVLSAVRVRRAAHNLAFGMALAAHTSSDPDTPADGADGVWHLEALLPLVILPLARSAPVLLLVLDGMSAGVGTEILASVLSRAGDGWVEALLPGQTRRAAALAVLPTLTEVSRASLLTGRLTTGGQDAELRGYQALTDAHRVGKAVLFHKKPLDSSRLGYAVADDVATAIADVTGDPLVTCVLNTIDDALDRSDPGGTDWGSDTVKHLTPLLDRARNAGRVVVLTADHGHIVERRQGSQRSYQAISSSRSRAAIEPVGDGEVLVTGPRVLKHDGRAVLAVDEHLRYGPLKAGYHGGGSPAEAVVPVAVLVPGAVPEGLDLALAPPQEPAWWIDPAAPGPAADLAPQPGPAAATRKPGPDLRRTGPQQPPTLFDQPGAEAAPAPASPGPAHPAAEATPDSPAVPADPVAAAVLKSAPYAVQKKIAGRVSVSDDQIRGLLGALLQAPSHRLAPALAATALGVSPVLLRGAVLHSQRLLNVEGYPVLRVDADGATVLLDEALLREQFGIRA
jgi:hypothetical protein